MVTPITMIEWRTKVRNKSKKFHTSPRIVYALRKLGVKPLNPKTVRTICNILGILNMGMRFVTPKMLAFVENTDMGTAYNKLHILGDKKVLTLKYTTGKKHRDPHLFQYEISKDFINEVKQK